MFEASKTFKNKGFYLDMLGISTQHSSEISVFLIFVLTHAFFSKVTNIFCSTFNQFGKGEKGVFS